MALLNCMDVGALGTCSLRYPYFSRNAWGRERGQLFLLCGILPPHWSPWHVCHAGLTPCPNRVYELYSRKSWDQSQKDVHSVLGKSIETTSWESHSIFLNPSSLISKTSQAVPTPRISWHHQETGRPCWTVELWSLESGRLVFKSQLASDFSKPPVSHL